jgi:uncharacterized protein YozE (UPF0346 family)
MNPNEKSVRRIVEVTEIVTPKSQESAATVLVASEQTKTANTRFNVRQLFKDKNKVVINIGGTRHEVLWKTLESVPASRLGRIRYAKSVSDIENLCDYLNLAENEIFFDKHTATFDCVINFYRTGKLHLFENMCVLAFHDDLEYWGIEECFLDNCCHLKYHQKRDALLEEIKKEEDASKEKVTNEIFGDHCFPAVRKKVWDLMENPQTSKAARVFILIKIEF